MIANLAMPKQEILKKEITIINKFTAADSNHRPVLVLIGDDLTKQKQIKQISRKMISVQ